MDCAKCSKTRLKKIPAAFRSPALTCPKCDGIWIPDGKALSLVPPAELAEAAPASATDRRAGLCPSGHGLLTRAQTYLDSGFYLDRCAECLGVWFDRGEWQQISAAGLTSGLFEIWSESWQRHQRQKTAEEAHRSRLEAELGSELVERIESVAADLRRHSSRGLGVAHLLSHLRGDDSNAL